MIITHFVMKEWKPSGHYEGLWGNIKKPIADTRSIGAFITINYKMLEPHLTLRGEGVYRNHNNERDVLVGLIRGESNPRSIHDNSYLYGQWCLLQVKL